MKNAFTKFLLAIICFLGSGQINLFAQIQSYPATLNNNLPVPTTHFTGGSGLKKTGTCAPDTVNYVYNKTTILNTISLNTATSGNAFAQWYPSPQNITVYGFQFFAWQTTLSSTVVPITCRIYNAGIDSMPSGAALASVVVNVDSTFGGGNLTVLRKNAFFSTPVVASSANGYVITLETSSPTNVAVVTNSWTATPPNGKSEWLSSVRLTTTFIRSYNILVGGNPFNADFIMQPFVSYNLNASFTPSATCMTTTNPINFTNTSSPVLFNRFYSVRAFFNIPQFSCLWDYGDSTGNYYAVNGIRTFPYNTTYRVKLYDTLYGWMSGCGDSYSQDIYKSPDPTLATNNGPICAGGTLKLFADSVPGAGYIWTGPNGFSSNQRNPEIPSAGIAATGLYSVQTVVAQCSSAVVTTYASVINTYFASNNSPLCSGSNLSLNVTEVNGAAYAWSGPNGFSSTQRNPTRSGVVKADSGNYQVTITLAGCGVLGPFNTLAVVNNIPAAPVVGNNGPLCVGQNLTLTAASPGSGSYNWSGPNNFTSSQQNPVRPSVLNTYAGTYSVSFTANGCTSQPANTNVVVNNNPVAPTAGNNGPLCSGQTLSLTASLIPGATYNWSGPNSYTAATQNPTRTGLTTLDAGTYSVLATVNGCASPVANTNVVITVNTPAPTASSNGPLCPGQNLQLTASGISGATYSWTGPKSFTSNLQNPTILNVTDSNSGIYSVTATTTSCGISSASTTTVAVNALPSSPNVGNNGPVCEGQNLALTASSITGATYVWSGPNGFSSSAQNPQIPNVSKSKGGTYSVYVTVPGCGTSSSSNTNAVVHATPIPPTAVNNSPVCFGDTLRFAAVSSGVGLAAVFNWTGPNNFSASGSLPKINSVVNSDAGLYSVTVTDSGCTSAIGVTNVTVKSLPLAPIPTSNGPICSGANLSLQASTVSGATYSWSGPDGFTSNAQNPGITGAVNKNSGVYQVRSVVNACYSIPATLNVVVNPLPTAPAATNTSPGCVGDNINLRAATIAGATYNWSGPGFISTLQNPILVNVTKVMSGTYAVSATLNGCTSLEEKTEVVINSIPSAPVLSSLPALTACTGDSLRFYASNVSGGSFEWNGPVGFGATVQNPVLFINNVAQGGVYNATVNVAGCVSPKSNLPINVFSSPATSAINGITDVKSGETTTLSVNGSVGSSYIWIVNGGTIQTGAGTASVTIQWGPKGSGFAKVTETASSGCKGIEQSKNINIGPPSGIGENLSLNGYMNLFPNPAEKELRLNLSLAVKDEIVVTLIDYTGRAIETLKFNPAQNQHEFMIPLTDLSSGIYLVKVEAGALSGIKKVVVR